MKGTGRLVASLVFVAALVVATLAGFVLGLRPVLGLDLVGGVSVILSGPPGTDKAVMEKALERIRDRVDALGVAEPDISLLGSSFIQVQLPGLGGQGTTVKVNNQWCVKSSAGKSLGCYGTLAEAQAAAKAQSVQRVLQIIGTTARLEEREVLKTSASDPTGVAALPFTRITDATGAVTGVIQPNDPYRQSKDFKEAPPDSAGDLVTFQDNNKNGFYDPGTDEKLQLGPVQITGAALKKATAVFVPLTAQQSNPNAQPGWQVDFTLNGAGAKTFGDVTTKLVGKQLAIVLDGVVVSAPTINEAITGGQGVITGSFSEQDAKNLAVVLNSGALPVQLTRQTVVTVSPTLGKESLRAGLIAGIVGLIALMLYLAFYYRLLGVVTWFGMAIWAILAVGLVSILGRTVGYALTLAGVAGIIVSLGITADSYIVFYERLKDEVRHGKSLRASVQPAFKRSWRTIIAADTVTIIAALVLYLLAVGSVRGFALTLGLSTALDMFVVYFFKRPTVFLMARSARLSELRGMGIRSAVAADPVPAVAGAER
jgi:preprotein translocase subunit SecD